MVVFIFDLIYALSSMYIALKYQVSFWHLGIWCFYQYSYDKCIIGLYIFNMGHVVMLAIVRLPLIRSMEIIVIRIRMVYDTKVVTWCCYMSFNLALLAAGIVTINIVPLQSTLACPSQILSIYCFLSFTLLLCCLVRPNRLENLYHLKTNCVFLWCLAHRSSVL